MSDCDRTVMCKGLCRRCYQRDYSVKRALALDARLDPYTTRSAPPLAALAVQARMRAVEPSAPRRRDYQYTALPRQHVERMPDEAVLEAIIETIEEELSVEERFACSRLPIGKDPVWWLVRRHFGDELTLDQVSRLWGVCRERIRQIESKTLRLASLHFGLRAEVEHDIRATPRSRFRVSPAKRALIEESIEDGDTQRMIAEREGVTVETVRTIQKAMAQRTVERG